jgi:hypothetical protein
MQIRVSGFESLLRYQSDQRVSSGSLAIRQRLGVNLGDNKSKMDAELSCRERTGLMAHNRRVGGFRR